MRYVIAVLGGIASLFVFVWAHQQSIHDGVNMIERANAPLRHEIWM